MGNHLEQAKKLKDEFKIREAMVEFEKAFEEDSSSLEAAANAGLCHLMMGNLDKSKSFFNKAIEINVDDSLVKLYVAIIDIASGNAYAIPEINGEEISVSEQFMSTTEMFYMIRMREAAFRLFEVLISEIKDDYWLNLASNQYRIVTMLARFGFFIEAKEIADNLLNENEKAWHGYASLGQIELEQGNIADAKAWFKKALQNGGDQDPLVVAAIADTRLLEVSEKETQN